MEEMEQSKQVQDVLYVNAINEFGMMRYCVHIQCKSSHHGHFNMSTILLYYYLIGIYLSDIQNYRTVTVKSAEVKDLMYFGLQYYCNHYGCFCKASSPTHNLQQWHLILLGLCMGYVLLLFVVVLLAMLYYQLYYRGRHYSMHVNSESGMLLYILLLHHMSI